MASGKREKFKALAANEYLAYPTGLTGQFKNTPKGFWTFLKPMKMTKALSAVLRHEGKWATTDDEIDHFLNACFGSKFTNHRTYASLSHNTPTGAFNSLDAFRVSIFRPFTRRLVALTD